MSFDAAELLKEDRRTTRRGHHVEKGKSIFTMASPITLLVAVRDNQRQDKTKQQLNNVTG